MARPRKISSDNAPGLYVVIADDKTRIDQHNVVQKYAALVVAIKRIQLPGGTQRIKNAGILGDMEKYLHDKGLVPVPINGRIALKFDAHVTPVTDFGGLIMP